MPLTLRQLFLCLWCDKFLLNIRLIFWVYYIVFIIIIITIILFFIKINNLETFLIKCIKINLWYQLFSILFLKLFIKDTLWIVNKFHKLIVHCIMYMLVLMYVIRYSTKSLNVLVNIWTTWFYLLIYRNRITFGF